MDLHHILQPQAGSVQGRAPKRPGWSGSRSSPGGLRHATLSSEPQRRQHTTRPPTPPQILHSTRQVMEPSRSHAPQGTLNPRYWLGSSTSESEVLDDDGDTPSGDSDSEMEGEDGFSVEFTLGSESPLDLDSSLDDVSHDGWSQHLTSSHETPTLSSSTTLLRSIPPSEPIDLTMEPSSPIQPSALQPEPSRKRSRHDTPTSTATTSHLSKRRRTSQGPSSVHIPPASKHIEEIDLLDDDDDENLAAVVSKQREEQVRAQAPRATEPTKLTTLQCTVCLDSPTDLTTTVCGKSAMPLCLICLLALSPSRLLDMPASES